MLMDVLEVWMLAVKGNWTAAFMVKDSRPNHSRHFAALVHCLYALSPYRHILYIVVLWLARPRKWHRGQQAT